jgi:hypothetical protein
LTLSRMGKTQFTPDSAYLAWAEAWLLKLKEANRHSQRYADRAFAQAVSEKWLRACRAARAGMGWAAWGYFLRSPLRKGAGSQLRQRLVASLPV